MFMLSAMYPVCYLTLYVALFAALLTVITTVGTSEETCQSTTTIHATTESVGSALHSSDCHRQSSDPLATIIDRAETHLDQETTTDKQLPS